MSKITAKEFHTAIELWQEESSHLSFSQAKMDLPSFERIVRMGVTIIPWILTELQNKPSHLFLALHAITGTNPILEEHAGLIDAMTQDWISWGKRYGYL